jgi:hypothetical protein
LRASDATHRHAAARLHAGLRALALEHGDDLFRRVVAEQLPQRLLVVLDAVLLHQRDKVPRREAGQRGLREVRILTEKVFCLRSHVGEVAAAAARDQNLPPHAFAVFEQQHAAAALAGLEGTHHPGRTRAQHHHVVLHRKGHHPILWVRRFRR